MHVAMAGMAVTHMVVPVIVTVPMITMVVIMVIVSETIRRLPHTVKLAMAGGRGHAAFYCRGRGAAGSWASRRFIWSNCGESVRSDESCVAGTAASMRSISAI
ncbi:MAG TPA: hypothetical protein VF488_00605, partial [Gemmatimonadaceae bacterium]